MLMLFLKCIDDESTSRTLDGILVSEKKEMLVYYGITW